MVLVIHGIHFTGQSSEAIVSSAQRKTGVGPDYLGNTSVWSVVLLHEVWSAIMLLECLCRFISSRHLKSSVFAQPEFLSLET